MAVNNVCKCCTADNSMKLVHSVQDQIIILRHPKI